MAKLTRDQLHRILSTVMEHRLEKSYLSQSIVLTIKFNEDRLRQVMLEIGVTDIDMMQEILDAIKPEPEQYTPGRTDPRQKRAEDLYAEWMKANSNDARANFRKQYEEAFRREKQDQPYWQARGSSWSQPEWARTLGVSASASPDEIRKAHRKLASKHHPDKGGSNEMMQKINKARDEALAGVS